MNDRHDRDATRRPLRLWPGVAALALLFLLRFGLPVLVPGFTGFSSGMMGGIACGAVILVWWLFFSRAPGAERIGAVALMAVALFATMQLNHPSMGPLWLVGYALPSLFLGLVGWAAWTRRWPTGRRRVALVASMVLVCGVWTAVRTEGINGNHETEFRWRWVPTAEQRMLAEGDAAPAGTVATPSGEGASWAGFRGPGRDGIVRGVRVATDWQSTPPRELWRRPVGPGWSSFAVHGARIFTQEQRGEDEIVSCYDATTGAPIWTHADDVRFYESNAGAGPRATPTLDADRVYTFGATGILNALDARDGSVVWSRDVVAETGATVPEWGFSSSPLVIGDLVVVYGDTLLAYDRMTGARRWSGPAAGVSYSSAHATVIDGVEQIVFAGGEVWGVSPTDGTSLWQHAWEGYPIVQPAFTGDGGVLIGADGSGTTRFEVRRDADRWQTIATWTSNGLKPYFNDFVLHEGHAYGFDGRILAGIDLATGERVWKGGRYGHGQLVLLADQDLLLVLTEKGELALVDATPDGFRERARLPAIEGKTWNHPVVAGDRLFVRNGVEMVAYQLDAG